MLLTYCEKEGIVFTAYTPMGPCQTLPIDPVFINIVKGHNAEPAQVVISWAVLQGTIPISLSKELQ